MSFSIHYRSTQSMHPAQAYEIKQHAERLIGGYAWFSCEPVILGQRPDGILAGTSKPSFFPAETKPHENDEDDRPDGTVLTLAEVLCVLSRDHAVDWEIGHDYEPDSIGQICDGVAEPDLIEQLETFGTIGDLLEMDEEEQQAWETGEFSVIDETIDDRDDDGPRVLKFPGV